MEVSLPMTVLPSIASANPLRLEEAIRAAGLDHPFHLDVEDGCFIPNITFGLKTIRAVAQMDDHLGLRLAQDGGTQGVFVAVCVGCDENSHRIFPPGMNQIGGAYR